MHETPLATTSSSRLRPSASYSITMRVRLQQRPGAFARVAAAIGETGGAGGGCSGRRDGRARL